MARQEALQQAGLLESAEAANADPQIGRVRGEIQNEVRHAQDLLSETERARLQQLWDRIDDAPDEQSLQSVKQEVGSIIEQGLKLRDVPFEKIQRFKSLSGQPKIDFLKELVECSKNTEAYKKMLEANKDHFSPQSRERYMQEFLRSDKKIQQEWIRLFAETQLKPRVELTQKYQQFSPERKKKDCPDFFNLSRHEKKEEVEKMEKNLTEEYESQLLSSELSKHMSPESKIFALKSFKAMPISWREQALKMLGKQMKEEAKLSKKFEKITQKNPGLKKKYANFYDLTFEAKQGVLKEIGETQEGMREFAPEQQKTIDRYRDLLLPELQKRTIGGKTFEDFMKWIKGKVRKNEETMVKKAFDEFETQIDPRRENLKKFMALPDNIQAENQDFFELTNTQRTERLKLLDTNQKENSNSIDIQALEQDIASGANTESIKEERTFFTILDEAATIAHRSETVNSGTFDITKQEAHLHDEKKRQQNRQIVQQSKGKKVLGSEEIMEVQEFNVDHTLEQTDRRRLFKLKEQFRSTQFKKDQTLMPQAVRFKDTGGQLRSSEQGKTAADRQAALIRKRLAWQMVQKQQAKKGRTLTEKEKEVVAKQVGQHHLRVDLRE